MPAENGMAPQLEPRETGDLEEAMTRGGEGGTPSLADVAKTENTDLAAYLRSLGRKGEPVFVEWWIVTSQLKSEGRAASTSSTLAISTCSASRSLSIVSAASWASSTLLATASSAMTQR